MISRLVFLLPIALGATPEMLATAYTTRVCARSPDLAMSHQLIHAWYLEGYNAGLVGSSQESILADVNPGRFELWREAREAVLSGYHEFERRAPQAPAAPPQPQKKAEKNHIFTELPDNAQIAIAEFLSPAERIESMFKPSSLFNPGPTDLIAKLRFIGKFSTREAAANEVTTLMPWLLTTVSPLASYSGAQRKEIRGSAVMADLRQIMKVTPKYSILERQHKDLLADSPEELARCLEGLESHKRQRFLTSSKPEVKKAEDKAK